MKTSPKLDDHATKADIAELNARIDKLDGRIDKLDGRMDKSESLLSTMSQQIDWLYKRELNRDEQGLIHDNRHQEVEETLIDHNKRIIVVENFVQAVTT